MPDLNHVVPINASPAKVYEAVATQTGMRSWWTADTQMEERVGGTAVFGFNNHTMLFRMTIDELEPGRCVVLKCHGDPDDWNGTTLRWDIAANDGGGSTLRFTHVGWRQMTDFCASCNSMWGNLLFRLKDSLEGRSRGPQWS